MAKRAYDRNQRAERLSQTGHMSQRARLRETMAVAETNERAAQGLHALAKIQQDTLRAMNSDLKDARYALKWYRRRWLWTMVALIVAMTGVAYAVGH